MYPSLIAFFGPDGSGKSTLAKLLLDFLESSERKAAKAWMRSPHTVAYLLSRSLIRLGFCRRVLTSSGRELRFPAVHVNSCIRFLWSLVEMFSAMPVVLFRFCMPMSLGYTVVAERCVVDTIVNIAYYTQDMGFLQSRIAGIILHSSIPKKAIFIHIDSDYSAILKRRGNEVDPYEFIKFQRRGYGIAKYLVEATSIDTSNMTIQEAYASVLKRLGLEAS